MAESFLEKRTRWERMIYEFRGLYGYAPGDRVGIHGWILHAISWQAMTGDLYETITLHFQKSRKEWFNFQAKVFCRTHAKRIRSECFAIVRGVRLVRTWE